MKHIAKKSHIDLPEKEFGHYLFEKFSAYKSQEELMIDAETGEGISVKYLHEKAINIAESLKKYITGNDTVGCICENEWLSALVVTASLYLGSTITLINPAYELRELIHNLSTSQPKVIFCKKSVLQNILTAKAELNFIETIVLLEKDTEDGLLTIYDFMNENCDALNFMPASIDQSKTAVILSSSGTSGLPKGVMITYSNLRAVLAYIGHPSYIGMRPLIVFLALVPVFHAFGLYIMLYSAMFGCKAVFLKSFRPESFLKYIQDFKVNKLTIVPPLALFLAQSSLVDKYDLSNLEDILCGAAPLPHSISDQLQTRLNVKVRQIYGLTEVGLVACVNPNAPSKPSCNGTIIPNLSVILKHPDTKEILPLKSQGEICLKGPTVFKGYVNNPEETKAAFDEDGYFLTGDIGYFDDDDQLYLVDRLKELIKCKGYQVAPAELESILLTHPAVKDVAVIGIPNERSGEVPCAVVVKQPGASVTGSEIADFLKGKVSSYKELNGGVHFVDNIPKNANGKIMKREIRKTIS